MEPELFSWMARVEREHWWFASRRAIIESFIARLHLPRDANILEPGCGTGGNFAMLARHGRVFAMDSNQDALRFAGALELAQVASGTLPDAIPFRDQSFDLILMSDVLEHLDDDVAALRALRSRLKPHGSLIVTVPATRWLWSGHDEAHHHRRRYEASTLRAAAREAGFDTSYLGYFNFILFPAVAAVRLASHLRRGPLGASDYATMPPRPINAVLRRVFTSERFLLDFIRMPFGVSLLMVARPLAPNESNSAPGDRAH